MRVVSAIGLCLLFGIAGLVLAFGRSPTLPVPPPITQSTSKSVPPPPPLRGQESTSATPATAGLACIQNALGGVRAFAGVSSLRISGSTKPTAPPTGPHPLASKREIGVVFPDRYRQQNGPPDMLPGQASSAMTVGFNRNVLLGSPKPPDEVAPQVMRVVRRGFVQEILMRLPRELPDVRLSQRATRDAEQERLAIDAFGPTGLDATLLADPQTCLPVALQYTKAAVKAGSDTYRIDLSAYRQFGGILFPTVLRTTRNGQPWQDEYVSDIQVNAPFDDAYFRQ